MRNARALQSGRANWLEPNKRDWVIERLRKRCRSAAAAAARVFDAEDIAEILGRSGRGLELALAAVFDPSPRPRIPRERAVELRIGEARVGSARVGIDSTAAPSPTEVGAIAVEIARDVLGPLRCPPRKAKGYARLIEERLAELSRAAPRLSDRELLAVVIAMGEINERALRERLVGTA